MAKLRKAIAIDFDGCLCTDTYPEIGIPNFVAIARAKHEQRAGAGLILWTCREGDLLQAAIDASREWGLTFDAINESLPEWLEAFGNCPRKVGASEYWDDKAVHIAAGATTPFSPYQLKFRGKRLDGGGLVEGGLIHDQTENSIRILAEVTYSTGTIITAEICPRVDPATIEPIYKPT